MESIINVNFCTSKAYEPSEKDVNLHGVADGCYSRLCSKEVIHSNFLIFIFLVCQPKYSWEVWISCRSRIQENWVWFYKTRYTWFLFKKTDKSHGLKQICLRNILLNTMLSITTSVFEQDLQSSKNRRISASRWGGRSLMSLKWRYSGSSAQTAMILSSFSPCSRNRVCEAFRSLSI